MNLPIFNISITRTRKFLSEYELLRMNMRETRSLKKRFDINYYEDYHIVYNKIIQSYNFDFMLPDESFLQYDFNESNGYLRYAFFPFPYEFPSYDIYLDQNGFSITEVGELFRQEYEQEISEAKPNINICPIRYEYNIQEYQSLIHPASHIHFGYNNDVRVASSIILTPFLFTQFVIKNCYYDLWKKLLNTTEIDKYIKPMKASCNKLVGDYFKKNDMCELFLT